ncbi:MAG: phosphoglycerate mutase family protein [bacterium]
MKNPLRTTVAIFSLAAAMLLGYFCWFSPITTVILVRHAEKEVLPQDHPNYRDPALTAKGAVRARAVAHLVEETGIDVIFATHLQRTQQTIAPAAAELGLTPVILPAGNTDKLVHTILSEHRGENVLVAGHSNTLPEIMAGLGVSHPPAIEDSEYDHLFIVQIHHFLFKRTRMLHLKFGKPPP